MCTLIVLHRCVPGKPLVVAANRDEFFARPAEGPAIRSLENGRILAPLDLEAGGTWVGLSQRGVFAGLTNLRPVALEQTQTPLADRGAKRLRSRGLRSRGEVVMSALAARTAAEAAETLWETLSRLEEGAYNPFQLCVADAKSAALLVYRETPRIFALEPGLHVVGNVEGNVEDERAEAALDGPLAQACRATAEMVGDGKPFPGFEGIEGLIDTEEPRAQKLMRIRSRVEKLLTEPGRDLFEGLARICREHVEQGGPDALGDALGEKPRATSPFESTCVHVADRYGTRSSLLLELSEDLPTSRLWTTDGPPCRRPFENRSSLLRELGIRLSA